jgi:hypothetical protein
LSLTNTNKEWCEKEGILAVNIEGGDAMTCIVLNEFGRPIFIFAI